MSVESAQGIWHKQKPKYPIHKGRVFPYNSDAGPHIKGPKANPSTHKEIPSRAVVAETWSCCCTWEIAAE